MMRCSGAVLLATLTLTMAVASAAPPQRVTLQYDMYYNGTAMAQVVETLQHDGKHYSLDAEVTGKGLFALVRAGSARRSSRGDITASGLRPVEYRDRRGDRPARVALFRWDKRTLSQGEEGRGQELAMPALDKASSISDRLSFLWSFAFNPPSGKEVRAVLTDGNGLSTFRYAVMQSESLETPAGVIEALKLVKQRDPGDDRETAIWLAPAHDFLPVRVLVTEKDGTRIDQVVTRIGT